MSTVQIPMIDWANPNVLGDIMENIQNPLSRIIEASRNSLSEEKRTQYDVIFKDSKQISEVIEFILKEIKMKAVILNVKLHPDIIDICNSNKNVQELCDYKMISEKITEPDRDWLLSFEKEVYNSISRGDINIYELADKLAVSERQLYRKTVYLTNLTPNKYIRILRMHRAKQMIENYVQHSISQLAYAVGYNDVHYFSRLFFAQYDITPRNMIASLK